MRLQRKLLSRILVLSLSLCLSLLPVRAQSQLLAQTQEQKPKPKAEETAKSPAEAKKENLPDASSKGEPSAKPLPAKQQSPISGQLELLTPTKGVDLNSYLSRLLVTIRRNWFALVPESARLGEKGRVVVQFQILRDGRIPEADVKLAASSGKQPLDEAALLSVRRSSPLEPLPPAFSGPYIELRFIFLYNLPLEAAR